MFKRGFKTWCEQVATRVRNDHGLQPSAPLPFRTVADSMGVIIKTPAELPGLDPIVTQRLLNQHESTWSAITIPHDKTPLVVYNPSHSDRRTSNDVMHELAHLMLEHRASFVFMAPVQGFSLRGYDKTQEDEANWLSGCLLLPREALLVIKSRRVADEVACDRYGVSQKLLAFRMNASGVALQFRRRTANL